MSQLSTFIHSRRDESICKVEIDMNIFAPACLDKLCHKASINHKTAAREYGQFTYKHNSETINLHIFVNAATSSVSVATR